MNLQNLNIYTQLVFYTFELSNAPKIIEVGLNDLFIYYK